MYTIKSYQFRQDNNFNPIGNPIYKMFRRKTLPEALQAWRTAKDNNDFTKYSALIIYDVIEEA